MEPTSLEFRRQLIPLVAALPGMDTPEGRTRLLAYLPAALVRQIPRTAAPAPDLGGIVEACAAYAARAAPPANIPAALTLCSPGPPPVPLAPSLPKTAPPT